MPAIVMAVVEKIELNGDSSTRVQKQDESTLVYKVTMQVEEVLQGDMSLVGMKFLTLTSSRTIPFSHEDPYVPLLKMNDRGVFAIFKENDGLMHDLGTSYGIKVSGGHVPSIEGRDSNYTKIVSEMRKLRDQPEADNAAGIKTAPLATVDPHPSLVANAKPESPTVVILPKSDNKSNSHNSHLTLWLAAGGAVVLIVGVWRLRLR